MSLEALRSLARVHGAVAWIATLALGAALATVLARRAGRRLSVATFAVAAALLGASFATGLALDTSYRGLIRQRLFIDAPALGRLFERKTHLAFGALAFAWCALAVRIVLARREAQRRVAPGAADLRRAVVIAVSASALLAIVASVFSEIVTRSRRF